LTLAGVIVSIVATIAPKFALEYFGLPTDLAAVAFLPAGIGLVLGSVFTPGVAKRLRPMWTIALGFGTLAASAALLVIGNISAPYIFGPDWVTNWFYRGGMLILTFLIGVGMDFVTVPAQAVLQDHSPDWIKGRVLAVQYMMQYAATVVYVPIIGGLADRFSLWVALGCVSLTIGIGGALTIYLRIRVNERARGRPPSRIGAHPGAPGSNL
jgi:MFS family permease